MRYVSNVVGVLHPRISRMVSRFLDTASQVDVQGRARTLRLQGTRNICGWRHCKTGPIVRSFRMTTTAKHVRISALICQTMLHEVRLASRRVGTAVHKIQRLRFASNYAHWTVHDWKRVFTDARDLQMIVMNSGIHVVNIIARATSHQGSHSREVLKLSYNNEFF